MAKPKSKKASGKSTKAKSTKAKAVKKSTKNTKRKAKSSKAAKAKSTKKNVKRKAVKKTKKNKNTKKTKKAVPKKPATKTTVTKTTPKVDKAKIKKEEKKDIITIVVLSIIIVVIIILTLMTGGNANDLNTSLNDNDLNNGSLVVDQNEDLNISLEEVLEKAETLQYKLNADIIAAQTNVFESWYSELGLEKEGMDACYADNNYSNSDLNQEEALILSKITEDMQLGQLIGVTGTPGIFVNGYKVDGYRDYNYLSSLIDEIKDGRNDVHFLDSDTNSYAVENKIPTLHIIYNKDNSVVVNSVDEILSILENPPYNEFFDTFFEDVNIVKTDYREVSNNTKDVLETLKVNQLPFFYLDGNIELLNMDANTTEVFNNMFLPLPSGGYAINTPVAQILDVSILDSNQDYAYGDQNAPITMYIFDDYDCPYCEKLSKEVLPEIIDNYVIEGEVNIVIKDYVVHQAQALFPAIFTRCAEKQDAYWAAHKKLFEDRERFGAGLVEGVFAKYSAEISELQEQYTKLSSEQN